LLDDNLKMDKRYGNLVGGGAHESESESLREESEGGEDNPFKEERAKSKDDDESDEEN